MPEARCAKNVKITWEGVAMKALEVEEVSLLDRPQCKAGWRSHINCRCLPPVEENRATLMKLRDQISGLVDKGQRVTMDEKAKVRLETMLGLWDEWAEPSLPDDIKHVPFAAEIEVSTELSRDLLPEWALALRDCNCSHVFDLTAVEITTRSGLCTTDLDTTLSMNEHHPASDQPYPTKWAEGYPKEMCSMEHDGHFEITHDPTVMRDEYYSAATQRPCGLDRPLAGFMGWTSADYEWWWYDHTYRPPWETQAAADLREHAMARVHNTLSLYSGTRQMTNTEMLTNG